jgi:exosortase E/protease (VPEID-CTERM system)
MSRLFALALVFSCELILISIWLDDAALAGRVGLAGFVYSWGAWILRALVGFAAIFATFTWLKNRRALEQLSAEVARVPIKWGLLGAHACALAAFTVLSWLMYGGGVQGMRSDVVVACWFAAGVSAIVSAGLSAIPGFAWRRLLAGDRYLLVYAIVAVIFACVAGSQVRALWVPTSQITFEMTKAMLKPFVSDIVSDPATMTLGTARFNVEIAPQCSGFEGAGLIAAFGIVWLVVFRKECRMPHALLLIPAGVGLLFVLNAARIAALILIGNSGAERIALGGFHSQAGWIAFNGVALGFSIAARELPWFSTKKLSTNKLAADNQSAGALTGTVENPTASYVLPFVAILAAGILATALSGDFEWLYPLRFIAAAAALWFFRQRYQEMDWRFGWEAPATGAVVFVLWIAKDLFTAPASDPMPSALAASSPEVRIGWLLVRILGAVVTVPIAEELAFRGFLMRRLISADFDSVSFRRFSWVALLVSSCLFGLLHGDRWIAGTAAGILYGLVLIRRGRIADAVVAHGTTNALLAIYVLAFHQWRLW